ncbi:MAG: prepilin-type N-terminal cleavage/methylation domain-containing protein [Gammaproteobacteria bacterium]|nr:prepilin-type N-terminal cleavage/methylation domain-containing protein [Gammaproteobacteria bacterium]
MADKQAGLTLLELIVVIGIVALLAGVAAPNFRDFLQNNRLQSSASEIELALKLARNEALKLGNTVMMCPSNNPEAATPVCSASTADWGNGLLVYAAPFQALRNPAPRAFAAGDILIKQIALNYNGTINSTAGQPAFISFQNNGLAFPAGTSVDLALCDSRGANFGLGVRVSSVGKMRSIKLKDFPAVGCNP